MAAGIRTGDIRTGDLRTGGIAGAVLLATIAVAALLAPSAPAIDIAHRFGPCSRAHPLGTDQLGRDLLAMLAAGGGPALLTAGLALLIGGGAGVPLGLAASAAGRIGDGIAMRLVDILFAFSAVVMAMLIVAIQGPGTLAAGLAIGLFTIPVFARVTRGAARGLWARDFVAAARLSGGGTIGIARRHILPNIAGTLAVQAAIQFAIALTAESALAYLGLGPQPPRPSWGRMLADGQTLIAIAPRLVVLPGAALLAAVLAANLVARALRHRAR